LEEFEGSSILLQSIQTLIFSLHVDSLAISENLFSKVFSFSFLLLTSWIPVDISLISSFIRSIFSVFTRQSKKKTSGWTQTCLLRTEPPKNLLSPYSIIALQGTANFSKVLPFSFLFFLDHFRFLSSSTISLISLGEGEDAYSLALTDYSFSVIKSLELMCFHLGWLWTYNQLINSRCSPFPSLSSQM